MSKPHIGICVDDIDTTTAWFARFGYERTFDVNRDEPFLGELVNAPGIKARIAYLEKANSPMIELISWEPAREGTHVAIMVDDMEQALAGLDVIGRTTIPDGRNAGMKIAYTRGPDEFIVELMEKP